MEEIFQKFQIIKVNQEAHAVEDLVAMDAKMELEVNSTKIGEFYLSPMDLEDFVLGYLLDERYIKSENDVKDILMENSIIRVSLNLENPIEKDNLGSYDGWIHREQSLPQIESNFKVRRQEILDSFDLLIEKAEVWSQTGGTHVAALSDGDQFIVREDVSRHVAIDKVIGAGLKAKINFSNSFIVCSGRIPPDRVVKLVNVGIPIMVTKAAPTVQGLKIGEKTGITLIGFLRDGRFNIYTHPHRILV
ncbi:MAG TPA: formate dehydrogenase accessory sulfurtransferase FdhD [Methanobacteriaceae archaeon]|nr:formate dehydrogenase accessory sulfurtransferase FdhD [Methanobacteriaceae archaeon]